MAFPRTLVVFAFLLGCGLAAGQTVVVLTPVRDGTLYQDAAGLLANGSGSSFFCGLNNMNGVRRGLVKFDVAATVPAGSVVCSAVLHLDMIAGGTNAIPVGLHWVSADWGEGASVAGGAQGGGGPTATGDATWIHTFYPGAFWSAAGGDFAAAASSTATVSVNATYDWAGLGADVQSMLDQPALNHGWLLKCPETLLGTVKNFATRESATASIRPRLEIAYWPGVGASVVDALGGCPMGSFVMNTPAEPAIGNFAFGLGFYGGPVNGSASLFLSNAIAASPIALSNGCIVVLDLVGAFDAIAAGVSPLGPFPLGPGGSAFIPVPIPPDPCLVGASAALQTVAEDPAVPGSLFLSNGLLLTIGL